MKKVILLIVIALSTTANIESKENDPLMEVREYFNNMNELSKSMAEGIFLKYEQQAKEKYPKSYVLRCFYIAMKVSEFSEGKYR